MKPNSPSNRQRRQPLRVTLLAAPPLLSAMVGFQLSGVLAAADPSLTLLILAMGFSLFVCQIGLVWLQASRLEGQMRKRSEHPDRDRYSVLRLFPSAVAIQICSVAALSCPVMLIVGSRLVSQEFKELMTITVPPLVFFQAICLYPLWLSLRSAARATAMHSGCAQHRFSNSSGIKWSLLPTLLIPAILVTCALCAQFHQLLEKQTQEWFQESHFRAWEVGVSDAPRADDKGYIRYLTPFDTVRPHEHRENPATRPWTLKLAPLGPLSFFRVLLPILLAAVFSAFILVFRGSRRLETQFQLTAKRIHALPNRKTPSKIDHPLLAEIGELNKAIETVNERFAEMRKRKQAAIEEGREQREMKAQFFAGMSHDLRSPLNSIIGFSDLLAKGLEGELNDEQNRIVLLMGEEAEKLMVLITDILDSSKLEAGRLELDRSQVSIVNVVTEAISEARRLIGTRPINLLSSMHPGLPNVFVDKTRLRQALVSLVAKTITVIPRGTLKVATLLDSPTNRLRIDIIDNENSISAEQLVEFRLAVNSLAHTTQGRGGKLGLGIGLARDVIRLHGGELMIGDENRPDTVFTIDLPLDESQLRE